MKRWILLGLLSLSPMSAPGWAQDQASGDNALVLQALRAACQPDADADSIARAVPLHRGEVQTQRLDFAFGIKGHQWTVALPQERSLELWRVDSRNGMQRLVGELSQPGEDGMVRPSMQVRVEQDCTHPEGRRLNYGPDQKVLSVELLDEALQPTGKLLLLDPPVPPAPPAPGVVVALLDTGVNYLQPRIAQHLARDGNGASLGYDYWDNDPRPFDVNIVGSPFFPARHGTTVANLLLDLNPNVALLPLRFPRPDITRLGDAVDRAVSDGARIMLVGLTSQKGDWRNFRDAVLRHPDILIIVTAGSDSEDIDDRAIYPAALNLPNKLTVGAADGFGEPVRSNWGRKRVDLLAVAEKLVVRDFDGLEQEVGGAEYAAAKVAALAARLAAAHPDWKAADLKNAILSRARLSDAGPLRSAYGVLDDEAFNR